MEPEHYIKIASKVASELNRGYDGVVITHGTDTMHYTSAALSFMLKNLGKPVVFVGSQRSSDRPSSDSYINLISATKLAASNYAGVFVVMHASINDDFCYIHRGTKVRKMHVSRRDAFRSINEEPIGVIKEDKIEMREDAGIRKRNSSKIEADLALEKKVALLKIFPGIEKEVFRFYAENYKGIVIEGTGLGHAPEKLIPEIERAAKNNIAVAMATQTIFGRVNMKVYSTGRKLLKAGVIPCEDMLAEVAYIKLMYALAKEKNLEKVKELMLRNIADEISERSEYTDF